MKKILALIAFLLIALPLQAQVCPGIAYTSTTRDYKFTTRAFATGVPATLGGSPVVKAYKSNSTSTEITTGITLTADLDGVTGLNNLRVDYSADTSFYATGSDVSFIITTGTVSSTSVVGETICNVHIVTAPATADIPDVNVKNIDNDAASASGTVTFPNATLASTTNITAAAGITLADDAITAAKIAANAIGASEIATDAIGADELAADAIGAAEIADVAIDSGAFAASAITTIQANLYKVISGTAQDGDTDTIQLASGENFTNDDLILCTLVHIYSGTGRGQLKIITGYVNSTDTATVDSAWAIVPDNTSVYQLIGFPCTIDVDDIPGGSGGGSTPLASGTAQAGSSSTIQLASAETFGDDILNNAVVKILAGTGAGQSRLISDYVGSTDTATITPNWITNPSSDSEYEVIEAAAFVADIAAGAITVSEAPNLDAAISTRTGVITTGTAQAGSGTTIQLASALSFGNDILNGAIVRITGGTGVGQARFITDYVGSTDTATVATWVTNPDNTSTYEIWGWGELSDASGVAASVWAEACSGLTTADTAGKRLCGELNSPLPRNVATTLQFVPFSGGVITKNASSIACKISKDGGAFAALDTPNLTEVESTSPDAAIWRFSLIQAETDAERAVVVCGGTGMSTVAIALEFRAETQ